MNKEEQQLIEEVKNLFLKYKLKECFQKVNEVDKGRSFKCHQTLQMYKGLSLFEQSQFNQGYECLDQIIEESEKQKGDLVESIDVATHVLYQVQVFYVDISKSEKRNEKLLKICENYKKQHEKTDSYEEGIYQFGIGIYRFIETNREEDRLDFIQFLEKAYELVEDYKQDIMNFLAWIFYSKNQLEKAEEWSYKLYNLNPQYPGIANNLAIILNNKDKVEEAEKLYYEAEQLCPYNHVVLHNIAYYFNKKGDVEKEREYLLKAYNLQPKSAQSCQKYGRFLYKNYNKDEAIKILNEGIEIDPLIIGNYEELSNIANNENQYENAILHLKKCNEINPDEGYYFYKLGECYEANQQFREAIQAYQQSIAIKNYQNVKIAANSRIAYCEYRCGNYAQSLIEYFNTCNYNCTSYSFDLDIQSIVILINEFPITLKELSYIINSQTGYSLTKFDEISKNIEFHLLKQLFLYKLDILLASLSSSAYQKYIKPLITYQNQFSHLDLYFD